MNDFGVWGNFGGLVLCFNVQICDQLIAKPPFCRSVFNEVIQDFGKQHEIHEISCKERQKSPLISSLIYFKCLCPHTKLMASWKFVVCFSNHFASPLHVYENRFISYSIFQFTKTST